MKSQLRRLFWAAFLSSCGFITTFLWYDSTQKTKKKETEDYIAQVEKPGENSLRRSSTSFSWYPLQSGDSLYNGDSIKTSSNSEVQIRFDEKKFITLESDTMIVLQKNKNEIALDLMEGSLFVNTKNSSADSGAGLVLNSSEGKVDLSQASANLSKGKDNSVDIQVLEGQAKISNKDGQSQDISQGKSGALGQRGMASTQSEITILSPSTEKVIYVDPDNNSPILFQWKGFPNQTKVSLVVSEKRKDLVDGKKELNEISAADFNVDKIQHSLTQGKKFWQLIAKNQSGQIVGKSSIYKIQIQNLAPLTILNPETNALFKTEKEKMDVNFRWQKMDDISQVNLEVATDPQLKNKISNQAFRNEDQFSLPQLKIGEYFWRVTTYYKQSEKPVVGKINKFTIQVPIPEKPKDPAAIQWITPETTTVQYFVSEPTLQLGWTAKTRQDEIEQWRLSYKEINDQSPQEQKIILKETQVKTKMPQPGNYKIYIEALNKNNEVIGQTTTRNMKIESLPVIAAPVIYPETGDLKAGRDGRTEIRWQNLSAAKKYLFIVKDQAGIQKVSVEYTQTHTRLKSLQPGKYTLQVIGIDEFGRKGKEAPPRNLIVPETSDVRAPANIKVNAKDE